ncbi:hypothetical protein [Salinisphaera aquimarina]|uniref:Uncharacterized protein n=1 Tax=Salinisphaera aquimarina TaxID=2094031 RepID=A0ABV7ESD9_9GAMM
MFCIGLTLGIGPEAMKSRQATRVAMRYPAPTPDKRLVGQPGLRIEACGANGRAVFRRRVATQPFESTIEVATRASDRSFERRTAGDGGVVFHAVIPDRRTHGTVSHPAKSRDGGSPTRR